MLPRVLEPEVMDSAEDAAEYDAMDHAAVNEIFVTDLVAALKDWSLQRPMPWPSKFSVLDLGAGTAQIPIELARRELNVQVAAVDAAESMLSLANNNIRAAGLCDRITSILDDAKHLRLDSRSFDVVISNSILHHVPEPRDVIAEAVRVVKPGGLLFHRDLARPSNESELQRLITVYADGATSYQRRLFADSLRAALTVSEVMELVAAFGFDRDTVRMTSDRHWTLRTWTKLDEAVGG